MDEDRVAAEAGPSTATAHASDREARLYRRNAGQRQRAHGMAALSQRLPGQRLPLDPSIEQPDAASLTYGWHYVGSDDEDDEQAQRRGRGREGEAAAAAAAAPAEHATSDEEDNDDDADFGGARAPPWAPVWPGAPRQGDLARQRAHRRYDEQQQRESVVGVYVARAGLWLQSLVYGSEEASMPANAANDSGQDAGTNKDDAGDSSSPESESFVCRICFDGPGSIGEGGESLGRLFAPCRCRGTMKFVHQGCLMRWRALSVRSNSVVACDQCGYPYRFRKSRFVGLATNRWLLMLVSCFFFLSFVWIVGFSAESLMTHFDKDQVAKTSGREAKGDKHSGTSSPESRSMTSRLYDWVNIDTLDDSTADDVYYTSRYSYGWGLSEPYAYYTLGKAAVKYVGSGRVFQHVWPTSDVLQTEQAEESLYGDKGVAENDDKGWWSTLVDDWKFGRGGVWEGKRPKSDSDSDGEATFESAAMGVEGAARSATQGSTPSVHRERYDARSATPLRPDEKRATRTQSKTSNTFDQRKALLSRLFERLLLQISLGASLVGISSFLSLLMGVSVWGPFHMNLGLGRGFARLARRRGAGGRSGGSGGRSEGEALVAVFLLFLVLIGIIRALIAVYALTQHMSRRMLVRVEDIIVDWSGEEEPSPPPSHIIAAHENAQPQQPRMQSWLQRFPPIERIISKVRTFFDGVFRPPPRPARDMNNFEQIARASKGVCIALLFLLVQTVIVAYYM